MEKGGGGEQLTSYLLFVHIGINASAISVVLCCVMLCVCVLQQNQSL